MALKNVIGPLSYAVIKNMHLDVKGKSFSFDLHVYADETKAEEKKHLLHISRSKGQPVVALVDLLPEGVNPQNPPVEPLPAGIYLGADMQPYESIDDQLVYFSGGENQIFTHGNDRYVCRNSVCVKNNDHWIEADFDKFFSLAELSKVNNNPVKAAYEFAKTQFPGAIDV